MKDWLLAPFRLVFRVAGRFRQERLALTAAALSFSTLLGLVPMIAVGFGLARVLPLTHDLLAALERFLIAHFMPEKTGSEVAAYLAQFAQRAEVISLVGGLALVATALLQMLTIEHAFNTIWNVRVKRPFFRRLAMHLIALLLGPLAFGASLTLITFVASVSFGWAHEPEWISDAFIRALPVLFMVALLGLFYWAVPNRRVLRWHALLGGVFAALCFVALQKMFGLYIVRVPLYTALYGAFSAIPIFLVWIFLSWGIILTGALLVAELPGVIPPLPAARRGQR